MNYIQQAYRGLHEWWHYFLGIVVIFIAWQIVGGIPFGIAILYKIFKDGRDLGNLDQNELLSILEPNLNLFLMLLMFVVGLAGLLIVVKYIHKLPILNLTTTRKKIDWKRFWFVFLIWGLFSSGLVLIDYFFITPEDYVLNFKLGPFIILCIIAIIMVPLQTSFEEYLFRGYLMQGIGVLAKNKWVPLIITSAVFGLLHIANPEVDKLGYIIMVYYIGTGLFLGIMTLMDEGMELALGFHAANNLFTALLVTADWTAIQTHSILKDMSDPEKTGLGEIFFPVFVVFPILLFILSKKYKWTNWQDKLFGKVVEPLKEDYEILENIE